MLIVDIMVSLIELLISKAPGGSFNSPLDREIKIFSPERSTQKSEQVEWKSEVSVL